MLCYDSRRRRVDARLSSWLQSGAADHLACHSSFVQVSDLPLSLAEVGLFIISFRHFSPV